jgi:hypothetical protein
MKKSMFVVFVVCLIGFVLKAFGYETDSLYVMGMAVPLFSDQPKSVDTSKNKIYGAFNHASQRAALKALMSYILPGGTAGTTRTLPGTLAGLAVGSSVTKFKIANPFAYTINGLVYGQAALDEILWPASLGTQGTATYCKYLVYCGTAALATTSGLVAKGNEALTAAAAKLPDLPDNCCAVGYVFHQAPTTAWVAGTGTMGTFATYVDLLAMPADQ